MPENSIVLPVPSDNYWLLVHISNYIAVDKAMVVLENYECTLADFPLKWKDENMPLVQMGNSSKQFPKCMEWRTGNGPTISEIEYILEIEK